MTDVDRGVKTKVVADSSGRYVFNALPPGRYSLVVEAPGFNRYAPGLR